jgi:hypothetical protein
MIVADRFRGISIPRGEPWGPSYYINAASVSNGDDVPVRLTLEMQSGDQIVVDCESLRLTRPGSAAEA